MGKIHFYEFPENRNFSENRKIQPHSLFKGTTAGDAQGLAGRSKALRAAQGFCQGRISTSRRSAGRSRPCGPLKGLRRRPTRLHLATNDTGAALTKDESFTFPGKLPKSNPGRWIMHMPRIWTIFNQDLSPYPQDHFYSSPG